MQTVHGEVCCDFGRSRTITFTRTRESSLMTCCHLLMGKCCAPTAWGISILAFARPPASDGTATVFPGSECGSAWEGHIALRYVLLQLNGPALSMI
jgi:hypothetical protein